MEQIREWLDQGNQILMVPGWNDSGPDHWQSHWESAFPGILRVQQSDWANPIATDWILHVQQAITAATGRIILVAHSLGCITLAHWAAIYHHQAQQIAGALLVAPADPFRDQLSNISKGFVPLPVSLLPFPSIVVASHDDPYCSLERSATLAASWGGGLVALQSAGHINTEAGFGPWPMGVRHLRRLIRQARSQESD